MTDLKKPSDKETKKMSYLDEALKERLQGKGDPRMPLRYPNNSCPDIKPIKKGDHFQSLELDDYFI